MVRPKIFSLDPLKKLGGLFSLMLVLGLSAQGATIVGGSAVSTDGNSYNLTSLGSLDWAYWDWRNNGAPSSGAGTNERSGGSAIGPIYAVAGSTLRGSNNTTRPDIDFVFSDGSSPAAGAVDNAMGLFNATLQTIGAGVGLDIVLPSVTTYVVNIWVSGYNTTSNFSASLVGATSFSSSYSTQASNRNGFLYTLTVTPDSANDVLSIAVTNATINGSGHSMLAGVSIAPIPEPGTYALMGLGLVFLFWRWKVRGNLAA